MLIAVKPPVLKVCYLHRDHRPLALREMPPVQILRDDERQRVAALVEKPGDRLDADL